MPLTPSAVRREIHHRVIDMKAYAREDGLFDIEARLVDRKPFTTPLQGLSAEVPAGQPRHDLWLRLTVDDRYFVRAVEASSDVTPYGICKEAPSTLSGLVGLQIASGWSSKVKALLRGSSSCTHLMEMLIPMATTAMQGVGGLDLAKKRAALKPDGVPYKLDSCYAYGRSTEVVKMMWPAYFEEKGNPP